MTALNIHEVLERAGADASAPEGSQAWALAQVDEAASELLAACRIALRYLHPDAFPSAIKEIERVIAQCGGAK